MEPHHDIPQLLAHNRHLESENKRLQLALERKHTPWSDDQVDGITWLVVITVIVCGLSFWLASMP